MLDQIVIEERLLIQAVSGGLMVAPVEPLGNGHYLFHFDERVLIVPARSLTPLAAHEREVTALVKRSLHT